MEEKIDKARSCVDNYLMHSELTGIDSFGDFLSFDKEEIDCAITATNSMSRSAADSVNGTIDLIETLAILRYRLLKEKEKRGY